MKSARGVLSLCLARCASPGTVRPHALVRGINQFGSIFLRRCRAGSAEGSLASLLSAVPVRPSWRPEVLHLCNSRAAQARTKVAGRGVEMMRLNDG
jgi:hypothetical protein